MEPAMGMTSRPRTTAYSENAVATRMMKPLARILPAAISFGDNGMVSR